MGCHEADNWLQSQRENHSQEKSQKMRAVQKRQMNKMCFSQGQYNGSLRPSGSHALHVPPVTSPQHKLITHHLTTSQVRRQLEKPHGGDAAAPWSSRSPLLSCVILQHLFNLSLVHVRGNILMESILLSGSSKKRQLPAYLMTSDPLDEGSGEVTADPHQTPSELFIRHSAVCLLDSCRYGRCYCLPPAECLLQFGQSDRAL